MQHKVLVFHALILMDYYFEDSDDLNVKILFDKFYGLEELKTFDSEKRRCCHYG